MLDKKEMTEIFKLSKMISQTSDVKTRGEIFKVNIQHLFYNILNVLTCVFKHVTTMLTEGDPFTHIQREIQGRQDVGVANRVVPTVGVKKSRGAAAVTSKPGGVQKKSGALAVSQTVPPGAGIGSASFSSASASTGASNKRNGGGARGESIEEETDLSLHVRIKLGEEFAKYPPQLFNGDFKAVVDSNIGDWKGKFTLLMLDPPFGILGKEHDAKIPAADILRECSRLLKPQGTFGSFKLMQM